MSLYINNYFGLYNNRIYHSNLEKITEYTKQLSTGYRVNSAKDDSAALSINTRITAQNRGITKAIENAKQVLNFLNTSLGGLNSVMEQLQTLRELFIQVQNGTYSDSDKLTLQKQANEIINNIFTIANQVSYNGLQPLKGDVAAVFNGQTSKIRIPYHPDFQITDALTVEGKIYLESLPDVYPGVGLEGNDFRLIFGFNDWNNPFGILLEEDNRTLNVSVYKGGLRYAFNTFIPIDEILNKWNHFAYTYDSSTGQVKFYFNGINRGTWNTPPGPIDTLVRDLYFSGKGNSATTAGRWDGAMKDFRLYNEALTHEEIIKNIHGDVQRKDALVGEWLLNESQGNSTILDTSGNGHHGIATDITYTDADDPKKVLLGPNSEHFGLTSVNVTPHILGIENLDLSDPTSLNAIDFAIEKVLSAQQYYGALQNRVEFRLSQLNTQKIHTSETSQRLVETDMAKASSELLKSEIKMQTSLQMFSVQYKQLESQVSLLKG